ncbi:hypothetical protein SSX86_017887 [Deinandra increscens subsp. villosa]|uniref:Uncharacterized protein n=1 Tax=Deinandra increscens subsp. villosa TaxID=3103831 RepID=A0AAP0CW05_9ASTR
MAIFSTTSSTAGMLLTGYMPSSNDIINSNLLSRTLFPCSSTISASAPFPTISDFTEKSQIYKSDSSFSSGSNGGVNQSIIVHASVGVGGGGRSGGGGGGGRSIGEGEDNNGSDGQSNSSPRQGGGAAAIPVYAAGSGAVVAAGSGAGTNHSNHRNTANVYSKCKKDGLLVVIETIITLLII